VIVGRAGGAAGEPARLQVADGTGVPASAYSARSRPEEDAASAV